MCVCVCVWGGVDRIWVLKVRHLEKDKTFFSQARRDFSIPLPGEFRMKEIKVHGRLQKNHYLSCVRNLKDSDKKTKVTIRLETSWDGDVLFI